MIKEFEKKQPAPIVTESGTDDESIRTRAYELYVERGMEDSHDVEDWLRAEEELASGGTRALLPNPVPDSRRTHATHTQQHAPP